MAVLVAAHALLLDSARHRANSNSPGPLFKTINSLDAKLFDAYSHRNLETLGSMVFG
jgi:hypothetical protein